MDDIDKLQIDKFYKLHNRKINDIAHTHQMMNQKLENNEPPLMWCDFNQKQALYLTSIFLTNVWHKLKWSISKGRKIFSFGQPQHLPSFYMPYFAQVSNGQPLPL